MPAGTSLVIVSAADARGWARGAGRNSARALSVRREGTPLAAARGWPALLLHRQTRDAAMRGAAHPLELGAPQHTRHLGIHPSPSAPRSTSGGLT